MGGFITHGWVAALAVIPASAPAANRTGTVSSPSSPHITRLYWRLEILKVSPKRHKRPQVDKVVDKVSSILPAFLSLSHQVICHELARRVREDANDVRSVSLPERQDALLGIDLFCRLEDSSIGLARARPRRGDGLRSG